MRMLKRHLDQHPQACKQGKAQSAYEKVKRPLGRPVVGRRVRRVSHCENLAVVPSEYRMGTRMPCLESRRDSAAGRATDIDGSGALFPQPPVNRRRKRLSRAGDNRHVPPCTRARVSTERHTRPNRTAQQAAFVRDERCDRAGEQNARQREPRRTCARRAPLRPNPPRVGDLRRQADAPPPAVVRTTKRPRRERWHSPAPPKRTGRPTKPRDPARSFPPSERRPRGKEPRYTPKWSANDTWYSLPFTSWTTSTTNRDRKVSLKAPRALYSSGDVVKPMRSFSRFTPSTARTERVSGT